MSHRLYKCRVALKFCGCCNPYVELSRIARHLRTMGERCSNLEIVPLVSREAEVVVILCGCPRACVDTTENRIGKLATVVVAGESVDGEPVREASLVAAVVRKLFMVLSQWKSNLSGSS